MLHRAAALARRAGEDEAAAASERLRGLWKALFRKDGPPELCPDGYYGSMFDSACMRCHMPLQYCPSIVRLRAELDGWITAQGRQTAVTLWDAAAAAAYFQGPGSRPEGDVGEAVDALVAAGLLRKDGSGAVPWHFSGGAEEVRVAFSCDLDAGGAVACEILRRPGGARGEEGGV
jgi:hypothetical protein